ncbi:hypothetical protein AAEU29_10530 [Pseudoalteromonas sp. SSM20]|uniref:hypothetical protein n=1 Tax=Pseudoalteromonas sp. SSM20 TaxID=3139394 RepID=UPI003BA8C055
MPAKKISPLSIGLPTNVFGKYSEKSKSGEAYQMYNPLYGISGFAESTKRNLSLGSSRKEAIKMAKEIVQKAEQIIEQLGRDKIIQLRKQFMSDNTDTAPTEEQLVNLVEPLKQEVFYNDTNLTINIIIDYLIEYDNSNDLAENTVKSYKTHYNKIRSFMGNQPPSILCTTNIDAHIESLKKDGKTASAKKLKSAYDRLLKFGKRKNFLTYDRIPTDDLETIRVRVKRSRIEHSHFENIQAKPDQVVEYKHYNELSLALQTRPVELSLMRTKKGIDLENRLADFEQSFSQNYKPKTFSDSVKILPYSYIDDENEVVHIFQSKTGSFRNVPFSHKLTEHSLTVGELIEKVKEDLPLQSNFVLCHQKNRGRAKAGDPISPKAAANNFRKQVTKLNEKWLSGVQPSLYEIRSLSARLLNKHKGNSLVKPENKKGSVTYEIMNAQCASKGTAESLGHTHLSKSTETYLSKRTTSSAIA